MNAKNASGNTPLHVCAVDNQEACARLLLFRGADREALNFANQTPYQVAVIAGNLELAALIHRFRTDDVVPFKEVPSFNPRRRMSMASMRHSMSSSSVMHLMASAGDNASSIGSSSTTGSSGTPSPTLVYSRPLMLRRQAPSPSQSHWFDHSHLQFSNSSNVQLLCSYFFFFLQKEVQLRWLFFLSECNGFHKLYYYHMTSHFHFLGCVK